MRQQALTLLLNFFLLLTDITVQMPEEKLHDCYTNWP